LDAVFYVISKFILLVVVVGKIMYNYLILRNYHMHLVHSMVVVWRRYSMRRIGLLIIIGLLLLGFTGCSVNTSNENNMEKEDEYGEIDDEVVDSADPQVEKHSMNHLLARIKMYML
jgi:phosphatidylglycerophosphatase A